MNPFLHPFLVAEYAFCAIVGTALGLFVAYLLTIWGTVIYYAMIAVLNGVAEPKAKKQSLLARAWKGIWGFLIWFLTFDPIGRIIDARRSTKAKLSAKSLVKRA